MKKLIAVLLVLAMLCGLSACGASDKKSEETSEVTSTVEQETSEEASSEEEKRDPVTITMYPVNANITSGTVGGWMGEFLLEHGFILEIWAYSDEKLNAMMASGDLPDIVLSQGKDVAGALAQSGLLVDLGENMDKLPNIAENESLMTAFQYVQDYVTGGEKNLMALNVGPASQLPSISTLKFNWEVYEQIGCPEFDNLDELIDVFKEMQEAYPTSSTGKDTYAMYLFNSMDKNNFYNAISYYSIQGYSTDLSYFGVMNETTQEYTYLLDEGSLYKDALKFMNTMYREGLLDPDSITTDRPTQYAVLENHDALAGWPAVPGWENWGYYPAYSDSFKAVYSSAGNPFGTDQYIGVNAKSENVDAALEFVNLWADPYFVRTMQSGPQGEFWDIDAEGKAFVTEKGYARYVNGEASKIGDEDYVPFNCPFILYAYTVLEDGGTVNMESSLEVLKKLQESDIQKSWSETYGGEDYFTLMSENNQILDTRFGLATMFSETISDELNLLKGSAKDVIINASWKMVYAETDEAFEQLWAEAVKEAEEAGAREVFNWRASELEKGYEIVEGYLK